MDAKEALARLLPVFRGEARLLALIALGGGRASLPRLLEESDLKPERTLEVLEELAARGVVAVEEGEVRLAEERPEKRKGRRRELSPTARLAAENPHVRTLLFRAGKEAPKVAQPMAVKAPTALLRACEAALAYGNRAASTLVLWLPEVAAWVERVGEETVAKALEEAAKKAAQPFPYAKRVLVTRHGPLDGAADGKAAEAETSGEAYF